MSEDEIKAHVAAVLNADADEAKAKASAAALIANVIFNLQRIAGALTKV